jgi:16S rRNA (cytosine1402-N4)-methyltransferase
VTPFDHIPVLVDEVVAHLNPVAGGVYADVTLGGGGHSRAILDRSAPDGRLIGTDRDPAALQAAREALCEFGDRVTLRKARIRDIRDVLDELEIEHVDGVVADLGVSSAQLDRGERGFSLTREGPIDMRMDPTEGETALEFIARIGVDDLANVIYPFGEERRSRRIARAVKRAYEEGELATTSDLVRAVHRVTGPKRGRIDPATRTFQALRIAVNDELSDLEGFLRVLPSVLRAGGVVAVISFHSLEDRMVKHAFRDGDALDPLNKKPVVASEEERQQNPRSRSAKLRAARRVEVSA